VENRIKRAVIMADGDVIGVEDLGLNDVSNAPMPLNLRKVREEAEVRAIRRAMHLTDGRVAHAADMLGISRPTLYALMEKYGLK
jgi:two-component system NtrC family response regulator